MKKLTYLVAVIAALGMIACTGNKPGYLITGTVEGAVDGDTVFLQGMNGVQMTKLDTAIIKNGTFTFEGTQDSVVNRSVTCLANGEPLGMTFFLENGPIKIALTKENDSATGTPNNDAFQVIRSQINVLSQKMSAIYDAMSDTTLTDEQKTAKQKEGKQLEEEYAKIIKAGIEKNISNPVGVVLFKQNYYDYTPNESTSLLNQIPANLQNDPDIKRIKEIVDKQKKTDVGTKFIDFTMQAPDGKTVKLSDYVGKGKVVLVDFWASWCGPCRAEMPNLVKAYAKYKGKNFEILGVSLDQDAAAWKEAIKKMNMTWPQMSDLKGWQSEGAQLYAVSSIPQVVLFDGAGIIIARGLHGEELHAKLAEVLK